MEGLDPDMILQLLYQTHVTATINSPICHHEFPKLNLDESKLQDKNKDYQALLQKCLEDSYVEYKTTDQAKMRGSVDVNPGTWMHFFLNAVLTAKNNNTKIQVPNGCCNTDQCGIKKFYEIIYEHLKNIESE